MNLFILSLTEIGVAAFFAAVIAIVLFIWGYSPTFVRNPSRVGATVMGGKIALMLLALGSIFGIFFHDTVFNTLFHLAAIVATAVWLIYDYIILRSAQAQGKKLSFWRKWLPFDNSKRK